MAYAPILDPASYTSDSEPRRRLALAAARLLQQLASNLVAFKEAVGAVSDRPPMTSPLERVRFLLRSHNLVEQPSAIEDQVLMQLIEQLQQVRAFGELDGGSLDDHIISIARMIRGGRVELFAGRSARAS